MKLAIVAYLVPFIFVYKPALLLKGSVVEIGEAVIFAFTGVYIGILISLPVMVYEWKKAKNETPSLESPKVR